MAGGKIRRRSSAPPARSSGGAGDRAPSLLPPAMVRRVDDGSGGSSARGRRIRWRHGEPPISSLQRRRGTGTEELLCLLLRLRGSGRGGPPSPSSPPAMPRRPPSGTRRAASSHGRSARPAAPPTRPPHPPQRLPCRARRAVSPPTVPPSSMSRALPNRADLPHRYLRARGRKGHRRADAGLPERHGRRAQGRAAATVLGRRSSVRAFA